MSENAKKASIEEKGPPAEKAESGAPAAGWAVGDRFSWDEIHERVLASADEEIGSSVRELLFSGFTAGIAIVLTFMCFAVGKARFPDNDFLAALLFPIGFVYIIIGRYQLYTENTLPPVKLVLTRMASLPLLLRIWSIVLFANIAGAVFGAVILAETNVLSAPAAEAGAAFAREGAAAAWWDVFFKATFAGWLVAGLVWLVNAARDTVSRLLFVYGVFYAIAVLDLYHVVTAAADVAFSALVGDGLAVGGLITGFWIPVMLGNTAGGVLLFTLLGYAQSSRKRFPGVRELTLREVLFSLEGGRPEDRAESLDD